MPRQSGKAVAREIVQRRAGLWYTVRRSSDPLEWGGLANWVSDKASADYATRWIFDHDAPMLSASYYSQEQMAVPSMLCINKGKNTMPYSSVPYVSPKAEAEQEGADFALAFSSCIQTLPAPQGALYQLAYYFAKQYSTDVDMVGAFVSGFMRGWVTPAVKQLGSAPSESSVKSIVPASSED